MIIGKTTGTASTSAVTKQRPATASINNCCTRVGCFGTRNIQYAAIAMIKTGGAKSRKFSQGTLAKGLSQPPRNKVVATEATTIMFVYSARK